MRQPLLDLRQESCGRPPSSIAEPPPVGGQTGATTEPIIRPLAATLSASALSSSSRRVDVDVRGEQEQVDAVELDAVDLGRGGQVEHRVEVDGRLGLGLPLADHAGPGGVVQFRVSVGHACLPWVRCGPFMTMKLGIALRGRVSALAAMLAGQRAILQAAQPTSPKRMALRRRFISRNRA